ncbi:hypothetical protein [Pontibacter russatus]|uniref:hypothetical protein n=1 Tax=Pontibacter russatus TaxID=2694929 RepID=UPI00137A416E|nr:hypothetical protein [Pontibacter russatus]
MKVTISNYLEVVNKLDFAKLPEALGEAHQFALEAMEDDWWAYREDAGVKDTVDTYFAKLMEVLPVEKQNDRIHVVKPSHGKKVAAAMVPASNQDDYPSFEDYRQYIAEATDDAKLKALASGIEKNFKASRLSLTQFSSLEHMLELRKKVLTPKKTHDVWMTEALNSRTQEELDALQARWAADKDLNHREKDMLNSYTKQISTRIAESAKRAVKSARPVDTYKSLQSKPITELSYGDFVILLKGAKTKAEAVKYGEQIKKAHDAKRIDELYFRGLNELYKERVLKLHNKEENAVKRAAKTPKVKNEPKPKKLKAIKQVAYHDHFTEEEKVIKRFTSMNGREVAEKSVKSLLDTVNKLVVERKIRKSSHNAGIIKKIQEKLNGILKMYKKEDATHIKLNFQGDTMALLKKFTKQSKVYSTVLLLKRFIPMMGTAPGKEKAKKLLQDITKALKDGSVQKSDTYYKQLTDAVDDLMDYVHNGFKYIPQDTPSLSGLGSLPEFAGLGCPGMDEAECGCSKPALAGVKKKAPTPAKKQESSPLAFGTKKLPKTLAGIFTQIDQPGVDTRANTFRLKGDIGAFLGNLERKEFAITLRGDKGAGKTSFLYQLMDAFAEYGFSAASFTLEIDKQSDLVQRMTQKFIKPKNRSRIQAASIAPDGISTIREAAKYFDVIAIDSWSKLNAKQEEFDRLRKDFPNTLFLVIFQSTTGGTVRGGSMAEYDAGIVIQVDTPGVAVCEKNRYADAGSMGLKYFVHECRLSNDKA